MSRMVRFLGEARIRMGVGLLFCCVVAFGCDNASKPGGAKSDQARTTEPESPAPTPAEVVVDIPADPAFANLPVFKAADVTADYASGDEEILKKYADKFVIEGVVRSRELSGEHSSVSIAGDNDKVRIECTFWENPEEVKKIDAGDTLRVTGNWLQKKVTEDMHMLRKAKLVALTKSSGKQSPKVGP